MTDRRAYQRDWARRKRAAAGVAPRVVQDHGTPAGWRRHQYHGEAPCDACRDAWAAYQRARYAARRKDG